MFFVNLLDLWRVSALVGNVVLVSMRMLERLKDVMVNLEIV